METQHSLVGVRPPRPPGLCSLGSSGCVMEILRRLRLSPHRMGGGGVQGTHLPHRGVGLLRSWHRGARSINVKVLCFIVLIKFGKHTHELSSED